MRRCATRKSRGRNPLARGELRVLKVELHAHTDQDPADHITHTTRDLLERAADLRYDALAITLHDRYFDPSPHAADAARCGMVLMAGIERTIQGKHLLLINFPEEVSRVRTFDDVRALRARTNGLVVAPHPFYPVRNALRGNLDRLASLVDAVEVNAMFTTMIDFNRAALAWARANGKPVVGNTDLHVLEQMGTTYSLVDGERNADAICDAIRAGRVEVRCEALSIGRAATIFGKMCWGGLVGRFGRGPKT
jgi:predicted metal-dependent phosphoesterase TrpH